MDEVIKVSPFIRVMNRFRNVKQLRKILPCTLDNGQYDAYYALKAKDDLSKINVTARGSTTVTILIPPYQEIAKFQNLFTVPKGR